MNIRINHADGNDGINNGKSVFEWNKVGVFKSDTTYDLMPHISKLHS